jgi:hypothetical protein
MANPLQYQPAAEWSGINTGASVESGWLSGTQ